MTNDSCSNSRIYYNATTTMENNDTIKAKCCRMVWLLLVIVVITSVIALVFVANSPTPYSDTNLITGVVETSNFEAFSGPIQNTHKTLINPSVINNEHNHNTDEESAAKDNVFCYDTNRMNTFLDSTPLTVMNTCPPSYVPNLKNHCFYVKTHSEMVQSSNELKCFPHVILAGFSKSGTSDLHYYITRHQYVYQSLLKELHFWEQNPVDKKKDLKMKFYPEYNSQTAALIENCCLSNASPGSNVSCSVRKTMSNQLKRHLSGRKQRLGDSSAKTISRAIEVNIKDGAFAMLNRTYCPIMSIDSTPRYSWDGDYWRQDSMNKHNNTPQVLIPHKIYHVTPNAKIILIMRRPEDRLWSDYNFYHPGIRKSPSHFHKCVVAGINWWKTCLNTHAIEQCAYGKQYTDIPNPSLGKQFWEISGAERVRISIYYVYVKRWLEVFKRENILFVRFEDYIKDPVSYVREHVYPYLGLGDVSQHLLQMMMKRIQTGTPHNSDKNSNRSPMRQQTRTLLHKFYEKYNVLLADLLNDKKYLWNDV